MSFGLHEPFQFDLVYEDTNSPELIVKASTDRELFVPGNSFITCDAESLYDILAETLLAPLQEGDTVVLQRTDRGIETIRPADVVDRTAGVFASCAKNVPTGPAEPREYVTNSIAEEVVRELGEQ